MEIHKDTSKQLNDLLSEARHEKPVMDLKDIEKIVSEGKYAPTVDNRGFHIGINNLIVLSGIAVSSFLAYMALKVDNGDLSIVSAPVKTEVAADHAGQRFSDLHTRSAEPVVSPVASIENKTPDVIRPDKVQAKQNTATLLASNDNTLAVAANEADENIVLPAAGNMPSGEYVITFNYKEQDIRLKLIGDEVSEFIVDGNAIPADQYGDYSDILSEGKNFLIGNTRAEESTSSLNLIKYFDTQLRTDNILNKEVQYTFELSFSQLIVNGEMQPEEIFKKYKGLYQVKTGKVITEGSVYKFERGAKSE